MTYTAAQAAAAVKRARGFRFRHLVDAGYGSGVVLSTRDGYPGLGFGVVDASGESAVLALSPEEAAELRDALTDWLGEQ